MERVRLYVVVSATDSLTRWLTSSVFDCNPRFASYASGSDGKQPHKAPQEARRRTSTTSADRAQLWMGLEPSRLLPPAALSVGCHTDSTIHPKGFWSP